MIDGTIFTKKMIIEVAKANYNIDVYEVEKLNCGSANLYSLNQNKYILKEFQERYTREEINKEIIIINHLRNDSIPVPEYVKTVTGEYSFVYKNRIIIMQKFIDGYTMESNTGNYDQILESAEYFGKIDINNLVEYVKTFTNYVKLNKYDFKFMSCLYLIQLLTSTFGYK